MKQNDNGSDSDSDSFGSSLNPTLAKTNTNGQGTTLEPAGPSPPSFSALPLVSGSTDDPPFVDVPPRSQVSPFVEVGGIFQVDPLGREAIPPSVVPIPKEFVGKRKVHRTSSSSPSQALAQATKRLNLVATDVKLQSSDDKEATSSYRETLKAKMELVLRIMFEMETRGIPAEAKPPPPHNPNKVEDDDIFILWCTAPNTKWYKPKLFKLLEELRSKEDHERIRIRNASLVAYENDMSPYRRFLRAKMDAVKQSAFDFYQLMIDGQTKPALPKHYEALDLDIFLVWCLHSDDYKECLPPSRYSGHSYGPAATLSYEQDLGGLLESLKSKDEEEAQFLRKLRKSVKGEKTG